MGHTRLGTIPKTQKWLEVVALAAGGADGSGSNGGGPVDDVEQLAAKTLDAAGASLERAADDVGLGYTFYLLTQIALAARKQNWQQALSTQGIELADDGTIFDLTMGLQSSVDDYLLSRSRTTDISEMAQAAAGQAVSTLVAPWAVTLFGGGSGELQSAVKRISTKKGFSELGQVFFGGFLSRFLNFYLSRISAAQVGGARLQQIGDLSQFNDALQAHCQQTARIVRDFCGEWYSKTEFQEGINLENSRRFVAVAVRKLKNELKEQRAEL